MKKIAITGSTGLIGSRIIELLQDDFQFIPITHKVVDITNQRQIAERFEDCEYDILLHLAAYTNVDMAENEREKAHEINVKGTKNLFEQTQKQGKKMIYISTDFVFDGKNPPYDEDSAPHPVGYYGQTKHEGEQIVKRKTMIVRISYPYGVSPSEKPDFVQRLRSFLEQDQKLSMVTDSSMVPTYIDDIAFGLRYLMNNWTPEVFHLVGSQSHSPFEVGQMIAERYELPKWLVQPITFKEYMKDKAKRPQYSEVVSKKNNFQTMRTFGEGLKYL